MGNSHQATFQTTFDQAAEFRELCVLLTQLTRAHGVRTVAFDDPSLRHFTALKHDQRVQCLDLLRNYVDVLSSADNEGLDLTDSPLLTFKMIRKMGLTAPSDIFDKMTRDCVVELYNRDNIQIFRNLRFFEICSYTIEDIICREWWKLYSREDEITRGIFVWGSRIFSQEVSRTVRPEIPRHVLRENESFRRFGMYVDLDFMTPVYAGKEVFGAIVVEKAEIFEALPISSAEALA